MGPRLFRGKSLMARRRTEADEQFSLFSASAEELPAEPEKPADIRSLILRRRRQLLVHSVIYYRFNENVISDAQWSAWAVELENLQARYPKEAEETEWAEAFQNFDHSTGYDLPLADPWAVGQALWILELSKRKGAVT